MYAKKGWHVPGRTVFRRIFPVPFSDGGAVFLYLIGLVFGLVEFSIRATWWLAPFFIATILMLFILDYLECRYHGDRLPARTAVLFLCLRFLCVALAVLLASTYTMVLYLILPFRAMLYFGRTAAFGVAVLIMVIYITSPWFDPRISQSTMSSNLLSFSLICVWSILKAQSIVSERESHWREHQIRIHAEELLEEVRRSHHQLHIYAEQVATLATLEERNRVAREIHDSLGHSLTAIHLQLEKALVYRIDHPQASLQSVQDARDVAREALEDMYRSVRRLRTAEQPFSCVREIALLEKQLHQHGLTVHFVVTGNEEVFSERILRTLYRIAQEGCTNIQRHARASNVQISLDFSAQEVCLHIHDDGIGFNTSLLEQGAANRQCYGLQGIQERLSLVNGTLNLESIPDQGTSLIVMISQQSKGELQVDTSLINKRG